MTPFLYNGPGSVVHKVQNGLNEIGVGNGVMPFLIGINKDFENSETVCFRRTRLRIGMSFDLYTCSLAVGFCFYEFDFHIFTYCTPAFYNSGIAMPSIINNIRGVMHT